MFNWICPQCGREVLSSYAECPDCAKATQPAAPAENATITAAPPAPAPPSETTRPAMQAPVATSAEPPVVRTPVRSAMFAAPPAGSAPVQAAPPQSYAPPAQPYYAPPPQRSGLPTWLMSILFALGFVALGAGVYWLINHNKDADTATPAAAAGPASAPESGAATGAAAKPNPWQKFVEVTGVRLFQNNRKQVEAKFLIVNHSDAEMTDVGGVVEIRGRTAKAGEEPVGSFTFKIASLGPNDAKEATAIVNTKLKVYELPDWQLTDTRVRITSP